MKKMMLIEDIKSVDFPVLVEVDEHIPISVRTYDRPVGAVFYRVGNFETSLVEVPIDPATGIVRGVKIVTIDRYDAAVNDAGLRRANGLPVLSRDQIPDRLCDDHREVAVGIIGESLLVDWSGAGDIDTVSVHGRLNFFMGNNVLMGAAITGLTLIERQLLLSHWPAHA